MTLESIRKSALVCMMAGVFAAVPASQAADTILPDIGFGSLAIKLDPIVTGLGAPDYAISAPGDVGRLFVVEQKGTLLVVQNGSLLPSPALDLSSRLGSTFNPANANDERGFLGLAFHPGFNDSNSVGYRTLYTFSTEPISTVAPTFVAPNGATQNFKTVVAEWKMSASNPNVVDPASHREVISFGKNANNHNGGTITFGKDGYLYIGLGDGGNANDVGPSHIEPGGNAQNLGTPLGKMLRIDPVNPALTAASGNALSTNGQYRVPLSNPSSVGSVIPEIYATGFRNPYRFSVDRLTGQIIVADVGQNNVEEINRLEAGKNYGWAVKEGTFLFNRTGIGPLAAGSVGANSPGSPLIPGSSDTYADPITGLLGVLEYDHTEGISITGGFVYRGTLISELYGKYVFGDLALRNAPPRVDGRLFYADLETGVIKEFLLPQFTNGKLPDGLTVHGFGEDAAGELYALVTNTPANGTGGILYMLTPVPEPESWAMFGVGALLLATRLRRRGRRAYAGSRFDASASLLP